MAPVIGMGAYGAGMGWGGVLAPVAPAHRPQRIPSCPKPPVGSSQGGGKGWGVPRRGPQKGTRKGRGALHGASTIRSPPSPGGVAQGAPQQRLCGVAVITSALHAEGPGFEPQRSHPTRIFCAFSPSAPFAEAGGTRCHCWGGTGSPHNAPASPWGGGKEQPALLGLKPSPPERGGDAITATHGARGAPPDPHPQGPG